MKKIFLFLVIIIGFYSCAPIKYAGKKSPKKYYEEFFIDQGVMQYFIKPVLYENKGSKFMVDYTFRDTISDNGFVTVNYSIFTANLIKKIDSAFFIISDKKIEIKNNKRMFIEKDKNMFQIRNSSNISFSEMVQVFENESDILVYANGKQEIFSPTKKTLKIYFGIDDKIIKMVELNRD